MIIIVSISVTICALFITHGFRLLSKFAFYHLDQQVFKE